MNTNRLLTALLCLGAILLLVGQSPSTRSTEKNRLTPANWENAMAPFSANR